MHLDLGQDRLAQTHPLQAFELTQRSLERPLEARFVAGQAIQLRGVGDIAAKLLDFLPGSGDSVQRLRKPFE